MTKFADYIDHGWKLVPITPGQKGPRKREWNLRKNCISDATVELRSAGLAHAYSGTCAIDVDDYEFSRAWLAERGVDLDALFLAADSVQISSGRANHGKLIYKLPEPLASKQIKHEKKCCLDFRCATSAGLTMQDVLPPSIHPDTGEPYKWVYGDDMFGDWRTLPEIPEALHQIWLDEIAVVDISTVLPTKGAGIDELRALLKHQDPSMDRDGWVRIGMAIHHETNGSNEGLHLWNDWSRQSDKYESFTDLETCWRSFHDTPNAVTVGVLREAAVASPDDFDVVAPPAAEDDPWAQQKQQNRERFKLVQVAEVAKRPPVEWLVEHLIPQAETGMIYGPSGAGKSFLGLDLAFSIASGLPWMHRATKMGTVVWIAAEAAGSMRNRAKAYAQARGVKLDDADLWIIEQALSLMSEDDADALVHCVQQKSPSVIIVDTLAAASGGANENSGEDMNKVLENCRRMHAATGAMIVLIHHTGKDTARGARGWSGIKAAMDVEISVYKTETSEMRIMETTKQRDIADGEKFPFQLQVVPLDFDGLSSCVIDPLDPAVLASEERGLQLKGNQRLAFHSVVELAAHTESECGPVQIQEYYDKMLLQMPAPKDTKRDRRPETARRALEALVEKDLLTVFEDQIILGRDVKDAK